MYISRYMIKEPLTVTPEMSLPEARRLLTENNFRHLPVVDREGQLVGMISDRDLRSAYPSSMLSESERLLVYEQVAKAVVADIMSTDCISLTPESTLDDALLLFDRERMGALPVLDDGRVVGILSSRDLLAAYKELFGIGEKGSVLLAIEDDESGDDQGRSKSAGARDGGSGDDQGWSKSAGARDGGSGDDQGRSKSAGARDGGSGDGQSGLMTRIVTLLEQHDIPFTRLLRIYDEENGNRIYLRLNTYKIAQVVNLLREAGIKPAV